MSTRLRALLKFPEDGDTLETVLGPLEIKLSVIHISKMVGPDFSEMFADQDWWGVTAHVHSTVWEENFKLFKTMVPRRENALNLVYEYLHRLLFLIHSATNLHGDLSCGSHNAREYVANRMVKPFILPDGNLPDHRDAEEEEE